MERTNLKFTHPAKQIYKNNLKDESSFQQWNEIIDKKKNLVKMSSSWMSDH